MTLLFPNRVFGTTSAIWRWSWPAAAVSACVTATSAQTSNAPFASELTPPLVQVQPLLTRTNVSALSATNDAVRRAWERFAGPEGAAQKKLAPKPEEDFQTRLKIARHHRLARQYPEAIAEYVAVLQGAAPEALQRTALLEMAQMAQEQNDLARAQQIYAQGLARWPHDAGVPEILLRQGLVYRQMGLHDLAIAKFYSVMTSALVLKPETFDYYQQLVLRAQNEIAETQYDLGNYAEASESFSRLLKLESPPTNRSTIQYRLVRCLAALGRRGDALTQGRDFLERYPQAPERPEVHFLCATALKECGRSTEALQQVLALLQEQHARSGADPQTLAWWQRRAGNEIANQFYQEGDSMKALDIYLSLAALDPAPEWQLPVWYQAGLVFERLNQPAKAVEYYGNIVRREKEVDSTAPPSLKAVLEMAKWRKDFLTWHGHTEAATVALRSSVRGSVGTNAPPLAPRSSSL